MTCTKLVALLLNVLGFLLGPLAIAQGQNIKVDIIQASLSSRPIFAMSVDDIADLLGRPTAVKDNRISADLMGPNIEYHDAGLSLSFKGNKSDSPGKIGTLVLYFSRAWDAKSSKFFEPFKGETPQNLNANWNAQKTLAEFSQYNPTIRTPEEFEQ